MSYGDLFKKKKPDVDPDIVPMDIVMMCRNCYDQVEHIMYNKKDKTVTFTCPACEESNEYPVNLDFML